MRASLGPVEARLELGVADSLGQRPGEARGLEAPQRVPDGRVRDAHGARDGALAELALELEPEDLPGLAHGHSPVGHRPPPSRLSKESLAASSMRRFVSSVAIPRAGRKLFGLAWNHCSPSRAWISVSESGRFADADAPAKGNHGSTPLPSDSSYGATPWLPRRPRQQHRRLPLSVPTNWRSRLHC